MPLQFTERHLSDDEFMIKGMLSLYFSGASHNNERKDIYKQWKKAMTRAQLDEYHRRVHDFINGKVTYDELMK